MTGWHVRARTTAEPKSRHERTRAASRPGPLARDDEKLRCWLPGPPPSPGALSVSLGAFPPCIATSSSGGGAQASKTDTALEFPRYCGVLSTCGESAA